MQPADLIRLGPKSGQVQATRSTPLMAYLENNLRNKAEPGILRTLRSDSVPEFFGLAEQYEKNKGANVVSDKIHDFVQIRNSIVKTVTEPLGYRHSILKNITIHFTWFFGR